MRHSMPSSACSASRSRRTWSPSSPTSGGWSNPGDGSPSRAGGRGSGRRCTTSGAMPSVASAADLVADFHPWHRITTPTALVGLLTDAGVPRDALKVLPEFDVWPLRSPYDWWSIVMGSGLRWTMEQLSPDAVGARAQGEPRVRPTQRRRLAHLQRAVRHRDEGVVARLTGYGAARRTRSVAVSPRSDPGSRPAAR